MTVHGQLRAGALSGETRPGEGGGKNQTEFEVELSLQERTTEDGLGGSHMAGEVHVSFSC